VIASDLSLKIKDYSDTGKTGNTKEGLKEQEDFKEAEKMFKICMVICSLK
jgi:hypothetical protein